MEPKEPKDKHTSIMEGATVVGSGGSLAAGAATLLVSATSAAGVVSLPLWVVPALGIGAFLAGGTGAFLLKDKILSRAEKDAKSIEAEGMRIFKHGEPQ